MNPKESQTGSENGGVNISMGKGSMNVGGDIVGRDKITYSHDSVQLTQLLVEWQKQMSREIEKVDLTSGEKQDAREQIEKIKSNIEQDKGNDPGRLEKLINMLAAMSPDIFDVAITTLANPLAGIGLTIRKISDKAKIEAQSK